MKTVCRNNLVDKLVQECTETVEEVKHNENKQKCSSCMLYIVLFSIIFTTNVGIGTYFACKYMNHWYLKTDVARVRFGTCTQTKI